MLKFKHTVVKIFAIINLAYTNISGAEILNCENRLSEAAIPQNAFFLPESDAFQLQNALDTYGTVRLKPKGNYRRSLTIKLHSNQSLYGLAGTKLPQIIIPEGTNNALLSGVNPEEINFEGFHKPISNNCFNRITTTKITAKDVFLENNLFIDLSRISIDIDTTKVGYLKNNRFIRTMVYGPDYKIKIVGDIKKQSKGNQFIWTNILTSSGEGIIIKNQYDISFIGIDAESWNWSHHATLPGMMNIFNTDFVSIFSPTGADYHNKTGQYFNLDAKNIVLQKGIIGASQNTGIILGNNVENLLSIYTYLPTIGIEQYNKSTLVTDLFNVINNLQILGIKDTTNIQPDKPSRESKYAMLELFKYENDIYTTWQKPNFKSIPDPAGPQWQVNLNQKIDSTDKIQSLIDKNDIAELGEGIFYISKPLQLKDGQGIIGAGADKTVIIAKTPTIDMVVGATHYNNATQLTSFILADITLQGGLNGLKHDASGSGQGADYNLITMSHVNFRNMADSCILIDGIYAWDNNFIDYTNFYRCKTAIKQRVDKTKTGDTLGITFLDKNVFYHTQFIENDIALDWQAGRGNGIDAFINSQFINNNKTLSLTHTVAALFINDIFETESKDLLISTDRLTGFVNSYFSIKNTNEPIFDGNIYCNNCIFDNSQTNLDLIIKPTSKFNFLINSSMTNPKPQSFELGLIINGNFTNNRRKREGSYLFINNNSYPF